MLETRSTLAIVGASLAGAKAAEAAREAGFDGRVVVIGEELAPPYERPPLSKAILRGESGDDSSHVHGDGFYRDHDIEVVADVVTDLEVGSGGGRVLLGRGTAVPYDVAILATGAAPRRLGIPGSDLRGVHYLRSVDDAVALREAIRGATRLAVIGAGWIGSEVAASARQMGVDVVLVDPAPTPLHRVLGETIGGVFAGLHRDNGVELRLGVGASSLTGRSGSVEGVVLDDGRVEAADAVVVGIGVVPRAELAAHAGLAVDNGVVVDEWLATGAPGVFAAGDVASTFHPHYGRHLRVEHWANALNQGTTAGRNATGGGRVERYDRLPYFFSDQYDLGMEYVGHADGRDPVVVRGDLDARKFIAFWHRDNVVTAAMNVNVWDVVDDLKAIVAADRPLDLRAVADETVDLSALG